MRRLVPLILLIAGMVVAIGGAISLVAVGKLNVSWVHKPSPIQAPKTITAAAPKSHVVPIKAKPVQPSSTAVKVEAAIKKMTTEQKVGQLFMVTRKANTKVAARNIQPGGIIYFNPDLDSRTPTGIEKLSSVLQTRAKEAGSAVPLLIGTDQEYGNVNRLRQDGVTRFPGNMALGATGDPSLARKAARMGGSELKAMGININLAPVGDVNYNPQNPVIGERSFGDNPQSVAKMAAAATLGYQSSGIAATAKHFPGHGNAATDSHTGLPVIRDSASQFRKMNLPPFRAVAPITDAIMSAHISVPALDSSGLPATLSHKILTGLLRGELGYKGVIITDSLQMAGVRKKASDSQVPVMAIKAGADILLMPPDLPTAYNAVLQAVTSGKISMQRLNQSVRRIVQMKFKIGLDKPSSPPDMAQIGSKSSVKFANQVAARSVTVINPQSGMVPIGRGSKVLVTGWGRTTPVVMGSFIPGSTVRPLGDVISAASVAKTVAEAKSYPVVVVVTYGKQGVDLAKKMIANGHNGVYVVPTGTPYYTASIQRAKALVTDYGYQALNLQAVVNVLMGKTKATGKLPVRLP